MKDIYKQFRINAILFEFYHVTLLTFVLNETAVKLTLKIFVYKFVTCSSSFILNTSITFCRILYFPFSL